MKHITLIIGMLILSATAQAGEFVGLISGGIVKNEMPAEGTYWQEPDHQEDMTDFTYSLGIGYRTPRLLYIAAWDNLGRHNIDSMAITSDAQYSPFKEGCWTCKCNDEALFRTKEGIDGLRLAIATPGKGIYAEGGLYVYRADTYMRVYLKDGSDIHLQGEKDWQTGWEVTGGWVFENDTFVKVRYYDLGGSSGLPVMIESAVTLNIGTTF